MVDWKVREAQAEARGFKIIDRDKYRSWQKETIFYLTMAVIGWLIIGIMIGYQQAMVEAGKTLLAITKVCLPLLPI